MNEKTFDTYHPENAPEMMRQDSKTAAFLLVIPGCATVGYGIGLLASHPLPYSVIGFGAGLLVWGLIVSLSNYVIERTPICMHQLESLIAEYQWKAVWLPGTPKSPGRI